MADTFIQLPNDGAGKRVRAFSATINSEVVHSQATTIVDPAGNEAGAYSSAIDEVSPTLLYSGLAAPGSATDAAVWRIKRVQVAGSVTTTTWAAGNTEFAHVWDDRASLTYS